MDDFRLPIGVVSALEAEISRLIWIPVWSVKRGKKEITIEITFEYATTSQ